MQDENADVSDKYRRGATKGDDVRTFMIEQYE
jgi:hypothetical protein